MKSLLCLLLFSLIFNACGESLCYESSRVEMDQENITIMADSQLNSDHPIKGNKCNIINEWLNRKSMGQFIKNHISLEAEISSITEYTLFYDKFIP